MVRLFVILRKKGAKRFIAAIPVRKGKAVSSVKSVIRKRLKRGFEAKVVTLSQLRRLVVKQVPKRARRKGKIIRRKKIRRSRKKRARRNNPRILKSSRRRRSKRARF